MGFLRRRAHGPDVPAWAGFSTPEQFAAFTGAVDSALAARGVDGTIGDGFVQIAGPGGSRVLGLVELAQQCHAAPQDQWAGVADRHFAAILDAPGPAPALSAQDALAVLKVRLCARADLAQDAPAVTRPVAEDLLAVLVLDRPGAVTGVDPADAEGWGQPIDALWERAQANTRADEDLRRSQTELPGGVHVTIAMSDSPFAATGALWPEQAVGALGPAGALVAVPNCHTLAVHAITHLGVVEGMRHLVPLIARRHAEGPGSVSDQLYWSHGGSLTRIGATVDGDWVSVTPPAELVAALNGLPAP